MIPYNIYDPKNPPKREMVRTPSDAKKTPLPAKGRSLSLLKTANGEPAPFENIYRGRSCFLVCGGPSAAEMDLGLLRRRGIMTMCVNNSWLLLRPNLWIGVESPGRFADIGWKDPQILKMVPRCHFRSPIRHMVDGKPVNCGLRAFEMPNTWMFERHNGFDPLTFFTADTVSWGNTDKESPDSVGISNSRSVMLCAVRMAYWFGFTRLFIVGADFNMPLEPEKAAYAFGEGKHLSARNANNGTYKKLNVRFRALRDHIGKAGLDFRIYNCTPGGNLIAFERMEYQRAVDLSSEDCEKEVPGRGWYD